LLRSLPLATSASRRDIRLLAGNSTDWTYHGCIADSGTIGRVFSLSIIDDNTQVSETTAPNDGINTTDLAVIQGLDECAYTGLIVSPLICSNINNTYLLTSNRTDSSSIKCLEIIKRRICLRDLLIGRLRLTLCGSET
jgi:hypothetical protein